MKNEEKFKVKIAEIAARIAEGAHEKEEEPKEKEKEEEEMEEAAEESDGMKVAVILDKMSNLDAPFRAVDKATEFVDLLKGMLGMMPRLTPQQAISGMNSLRSTLAKDAASNSTPAADKKAPGAMFDKMKAPKAGSEELPALQEAFNRINRK